MQPAEFPLELVPTVVLLITPVPETAEPETFSSTVVKEPVVVLVPMLTPVAVPWPAAVMEPALVVTVMLEMEPAEMLPELVPTVVLLVTPVPETAEPDIFSSTVVKEPVVVLVPMLTPVAVPWPAAR